MEKENVCGTSPERDAGRPQVMDTVKKSNAKDRCDLEKDVVHEATNCQLSARAYCGFMDWQFRADSECSGWSRKSVAVLYRRPLSKSRPARPATATSERGVQIDDLKHSDRHPRQLGLCATEFLPVHRHGRWDDYSFVHCARYFGRRCANAGNGASHAASERRVCAEKARVVTQRVSNRYYQQNLNSATDIL
ncbi:hypothetical protein EVAR_58194_1 [Eumeta japonica]|uniref:Uncharacterized protein n=1 Tax=Eumeta variegata TaxID=151549 RepID=A0A4C1YU55_EUMVA|nr:hypothetical protein EVAR_58194_1 [Eumeta japonica]